VILLVGHIVIPSALLVEADYAPAMWLRLAVWVPLTIGLARGLLQPVKGAIVAIQWFARMHGFDDQRHQAAPGTNPLHLKRGTPRAEMTAAIDSGQGVNQSSTLCERAAFLGQRHPPRKQHSTVVFVP
jgi:hypothetical protein